ncbi:hypothetical protein AYO44_04380 [Planctomycetaceae bacterium SCGC AG-212-F19]|nr:hypothetical protein AYO44_04380 [Planctomycetaceae bacterium SCGC AG-212-F19]
MSFEHMPMRLPVLEAHGCHEHEASDKGAEEPAPATSAPPRVFLCDLTYTQQTISSDVMPAAIGGIASYLRAHLGGPCHIELFKYPESLIARLERLADGEEPHVVGFSNYVWNCNLSQGFAEVLKRRFPAVAIVFGGPNLPHDPVEQERFLRARPIIDFHIVKEGEIGFCALVRALAQHDFDKRRIGSDLPNLIFIDSAGQFVPSGNAQRVPDLNHIPSPYLTGLMDPFFDGKLLPIIQTNRGCPFKCTFCTEGMPYWTKVYKNSSSKVVDEIHYIANKMAGLGGSVRNDLHIADSNFGMYDEDVATAQALAQVRQRYRYPQYINVATGKNKKERVLEVAKILDGAMKLAGSVQSLDEIVLTNIKRANISVDQLMELALNANQIGANSYSEVILGLPGDRLAAHFETLRLLVEAGFNTIAMYQLMILPGTEMGSDASRRQYQMQTRFRLLPRCYGFYDLLGGTIETAEIEEICVANSTLSFDDYINGRKMNFVVNVFYNDGIFRELIKFIKCHGHSVWDWLRFIYDDIGEEPGFQELVDQFLRETREELWEDRRELDRLIHDRAFLQRVIAGEVGGNLMFKYKGMSITHYLDAVAATARRAVHRMLRGRADPASLRFADEIIQFNVLRMRDVFVAAPVDCVGMFDFDVCAFAADEVPAGVDRYQLPRPAVVRFAFSDEQRATLQSYLALFGNTRAGVSRILSRVYIRKLLRQPRLLDGKALTENDRILLTGQASLTGLNEFE